MYAMYAEATALHPDGVALDGRELSQEPLWRKKRVMCNASALKLGVGLVSTNWQDTYARKAEEYDFLNITEYRVVDFRNLEGKQSIGNSN